MPSNLGAVVQAVKGKSQEPRRLYIPYISRKPCALTQTLRDAKRLRVTQHGIGKGAKSRHPAGGGTLAPLWLGGHSPRGGRGGRAAWEDGASPPTSGQDGGPPCPEAGQAPHPSLPSQAVTAYVTPGREQAGKGRRGMAGQASASQRGRQAARRGGAGPARDPHLPSGAD